ncbi:MAG TPA: STT3 domain-containing protein, partial [Thermoplasmata archaeon]
MDDGKGWLRTHWRTVAVLVLIFGVALFLRVYFVAGLAFNQPNVNCDTIYTLPVSGGSDSYYWHRALCYSFQTGKDLGTDPMLSYPFTLPNPRPPLFPWFSLVVGRLFAPLFGDAWKAVMFTFLLSTGLFGALTVFPTYALAKEAFGRRAGIVAALLLAISVGHLQRSASTDADHDAFTLFFVVSTFYCFLRALKTMNRKRWVENWFRRDSITSGLRAFFRENRASVLYALLAGLCVAVIALAWQGWAYVSVILIVWFAVELFLARLRNDDTMGTWILFTLALATPLALAFQWYLVRAQIRVWFDVPAYLFFAAFVLGLAFSVTRDYPWTLVIPSTLIAGAVGLGIGVLVNPTLASAFFTGAGYFVQTKVVTTIAEDQSPGMSQMILSFGLFTFGMSLLAVAYLLWQIPRRREPAYSLVVVWAFAAIFMAITAARFIFNASPAFAISAGYAIDQVLVRADFTTMRRTYRSLAAGSWRNAVRKSLKPRHVLVVLGIVFLVVLPNVWWAVDASIPFELKTQYDQQVANLLPSFLRSPGYSPSSGSPFYFGAFGYSVPKPTDYYPAAWQWFATQDSNTPPELRPAYLSWWDYGFEAVDRGAHPTVADNFQDGVAIAGQFITAQNETAGIALLTIRLLEGDFVTHRRDFRPAVKTVLLDAGLPVETIRSVFARSQDYISVVLADPVTFGLWAPDLQPLNAQFIFLTSLFTRRMSEDRIVSLYHDVRAATGWDIGYFAVDARLFPISASNTGIFYAPAKLSDHRVLNLPDGRVLPFEFFQILATTNRGSNIPIQFVAPGDQIQSQTIQYQPAFYHSMFYRAYIGYSPKDLNSTDTGVPGFSQALQANPPVPAWNLTHWRVVYRTAYYNPFPDPANHTTAWQAMNFDQAQRMQSAIQAGTIKGVVDLSTQSTVANGVVFLRYYDGAMVNGTVYAGSTPLPHVWITVTDELGTPHYVTQSDAQGHYSAIVPFGNVTITASIGNLIRTTLVGARSLASVTLPVTIDQAMRAPADANGDGVPDWMITRDFHVASHTAQGTVFFDLNRDGSFGAADISAPGTTITLTHALFGYSRTATSATDGTYTIAGLPEGSYRVSIGLNGRTLTAATLTITQTDATQGIAVPYAAVRGFTVSSLGGVEPSAQMEFLDETNSTIIPVTSAADGSFLVRPLLAGNYTLTATDGDLASIPTRIRAANADQSLNVTLLPVGTVSGTTTLFGTAQPFATLSFQSASEPRTVRQTTSDANVRYSIRLPAGEWFVSGRFYASNLLYATLGRVVVARGGTTSFDAMFVQGVRLSGTVSDANPAVRNPGATVALANAAGQVWLQTDTAGGYFTFLPVGTYDLEAFNQAGAYFASVTLTGTTRLDIALVATSETVGWTVYRDVNRNSGVNPGEAIAGAHLSLTDDRGAHIFFTTNGTGEFRIPLFANRTYAGLVTAAGFADRPIGSSSPIQLRTLMPIALTPVPVQVQGSVLVNGSAVLSHPVTVTAVPLGNGAVGSATQTDSNGGYGFGLVPGTYALVVDENVSATRAMRYQNQGTDRIVAAVGEGTLAYDINIVVRNLVIGNVT